MSDQFSPRPSIGVVRETAPGELRVALVPKGVAALSTQADVIVEAGAGSGARFADDEYTHAGGAIGDAWSADVVLTIAPPSADAIRRLRPGQIVVGMLNPRGNPSIINALVDRGVEAFALEALPRTSRAQAMDALSSQANVAGYKAVVLAAWESTRFFPMLTTAAGTVKPAQVLVLGVGVAGLQALATAKRLGGRTTGYDVRPEVAEQVRSVGAQWLDLGVSASGEGGYARSLTDQEKEQQQVALEAAIKASDVVITTALVPGRPAPILVTKKAVRYMRPGSVIIDMAGETGGNCELSVPGQTIDKYGVTISAPLNLPATIPEHASDLYSKNILSLLALIVKDGQIAPDFDDDIIAESCVTRNGDYS